MTKLRYFIADVADADRAVVGGADGVWAHFGFAFDDGEAPGAIVAHAHNIILIIHGKGGDMQKNQIDIVAAEFPTGSLGAVGFVHDSAIPQYRTDGYALPSGKFLSPINFSGDWLISKSCVRRNNTEQDLSPPQIKAMFPTSANFGAPKPINQMSPLREIMCCLKESIASIQSPPFARDTALSAEIQVACPP